MNAMKAAKTLQIPFAPAIIGFESKGNFTVPKIRGVVILKEHEQLLLDAIYYLDAMNEETVFMKKYALICKKWERIVNSLLSRKELKDLYGH